MHSIISFDCTSKHLEAYLMSMEKSASEKKKGDYQKKKKKKKGDISCWLT